MPNPTRPISWIPYLFLILGITGYLLYGFLYDPADTVATMSLEEPSHSSPPPLSNPWPGRLVSIGSTLLILVGLGWLGVNSLSPSSRPKEKRNSPRTNQKKRKPTSPTKSEKRPRHIFLVISCEFNLSPLEPVEIFNQTFPGPDMKVSDQFAFTKISVEIDEWLSSHSLVDHVIEAFPDSIPSFTQDDLSIVRFLYMGDNGVAHGVMVVIQ